MKKQIVFMDGFDSVRDAETQSVEIFSTKLPMEISDYVERSSMPDRVIDNVVRIYNDKGLEKLNEYLLDEEEITQDEREVIVESIYIFENH